MLFNKEAFKLLAMGDAYPYNEIKATRHGFFTSWLLLENRCQEPRSKHCTLRTSSLENDTVTLLIVTRQALPLPQDYCDVLDCMDWWGRRISQRWYEVVLEMMFLDLSSGQKVDRECLFKNCISFRMNEMVNEAINVDPAWLMLCWHNLFDNTYMYDTKDFFGCAVKSIQWIRFKIEHDQQLATLEMNNHLVEDDETETVHSRNTTIDVVPSTPQSVFSSCSCAVVSPDGIVSSQDN